MYTGAPTVISCPLGHCYWSTACRQLHWRATAAGKALDAHPHLNLQENQWPTTNFSQFTNSSGEVHDSKGGQCHKGSMLPLLLPPASVSWAAVLASLCCSRQCWARWPGQGCSLDGNHHQSTGSRVLSSLCPGWCRSGQPQEFHGATANREHWLRGATCPWGVGFTVLASPNHCCWNGYKKIQENQKAGWRTGMDNAAALL